jgi:hypothetical protein
MKIKIPSIELLEDFFGQLKTRGLILPEFKGSEGIIIFSDYSGERSYDKHYSYSFYIVDESSAANACGEILNLRKSEPEWKDKSFIEYKKLRKDKVRTRILPKFLRIFDMFEGLVITIIIDKDSPDYFIKVYDEEAKAMEKLGYGAWKTEILTKSSNILSILAFLTKRFLNEERSLTWYSDRDDIFGANQLKRNETLDMFSQFLQIFEADIKGKSFNFISDKHTLPDSDFLSIVDLSAGAVLDYYQVSYQEGEIKDWTKQIIGWMSLNSTKLKKLMIIGKEEGNNKQLISIKTYR